MAGDPMAEALGALAAATQGEWYAEGSYVFADQGDDGDPVLVASVARPEDARLIVALVGAIRGRAVVSAENVDTLRT